MVAILSRELGVLGCHKGEHWDHFCDDLPLVLNHATVAMYADDSTIYTSTHTPTEFTRILNEDL